MKPTIKSAAATVTTSDDESSNGSFDVILSAQTKDRDGDVLETGGWLTPLPDWIPLDVEHGMSVETTVGSGKPFINSDGDLQVRGTFSSTPLAQHTRTLVREGHIRSVSVAFLPTPSGKRELVGGGFVNLPSNREARIMSAKSVAPSDQTDGTDQIGAVVDLANQLPDCDSAELPALVDQLARAVADLAVALGGTATKSAGSATDEAAMVQSIHDTAVQLGATCDEIDQSGAPADTTKSLAADIETGLAALDFEMQLAALEE